MPVRLVVLASGNGSNLQALLDACAGGDVSARVVGVITNRPDAYALRRADAAGVAHQVLTPAPGEPRPDYDRRLADAVASFEPDWVILAGWMRILTVAFLGRFGSRTNWCRANRSLAESSGEPRYAQAAGSLRRHCCVQ